MEFLIIYNYTYRDRWARAFHLLRHAHLSQAHRDSICSIILGSRSYKDIWNNNLSRRFYICFFPQQLSIVYMSGALWYLYYSLSKVFKGWREIRIYFCSGPMRSWREPQPLWWAFIFNYLYQHALSSWNLIMVGIFGFSRFTAFLQGSCTPLEFLDLQCYRFANFLHLELHLQYVCLFS